MPAERRVPRERAGETEIGRNPSPLGHLATGGVTLGAFRGSCPDGLSRKRPKEKEAGGSCRPRAVSRQEASPSGSRAAAPPSGCRESTRGRRKPAGIRRPWDTSWQNPSPSATLAAPALRDVTESREGDGNRAESVTLGAPHGRIRPPRRLLRHLPCRLLKTPATPVRPHSAFRYHVAHED